MHYTMLFESLLVITSLKKVLLNHHVLLTCFTDQEAGCMLSKGLVTMKLPHVHAQVCADPKLQAQDDQTDHYTTWKCIGSIHVYNKCRSTGNGSPPKLV